MTHSKFGSGNAKFLLDEVNCAGTESSLEECQHPPWKEHNCRSYEVAGVECGADKSRQPIYSSTIVIKKTHLNFKKC